MTCEETGVLLSGLLDGRLSDEQAAALNAHLDGCPHCRRELEQLRRLEGIMKGLSLSQLPDQVWDEHWRQVYNRLERNAGYILAGAGATVLLCYALYAACREWLQDAGIPLAVRAGCALLALGMAVLTASTVREKLLTFRHDRYKEIQR
ncbi:MAG: zf-HC2 domain-containing protein [Candidatus Eisenbacteria bacterium]|jgi:anti-sigma factor RsiW|nr:zf-HC2 domain-containing protein [Candidatus Eisenbacteria bacterium]